MREQGRPPYEPTEENRRLVSELAACGVCQERIARRLRISKETMLKYFGDDYEDSKTSANAEMGKGLYQKGIEGDLGAMIFYLKTQAGWTDKNAEDKDKNQMTSLVQMLLEKLADK